MLPLKSRFFKCATSSAPLSPGVVANATRAHQEGSVFPALCERLIWRVLDIPANSPEEFVLPAGIPRSRCPVNPPSSVRASTVKGQQLCQGGILQAWPKTGHKEQCFHFYLSDFGSVMSLPLPTYLALSHLSAVFHDVGVSWWCFMVVFVDRKSCLGQVMKLLPLLGALDLTWSLKAQWELWAGAVLSALPSPLGTWGVMGNAAWFLKKLPRNQTQYCWTSPGLQCRTCCTGKRIFFVFIIIFYYFFSLLQEITHFSAVEECSNWSRALQFAFRNGFILDVGIKFR